MCHVTLSRPLLQYRTYNEMLETLLHELIHAWLFITKDSLARDVGRDGHGPDFLAKMNEINSATSLNLSVFHGFKDEVDQARKHVWLCTGSCRSQAPYFGVIQRAQNKPPGQKDWWFRKH